MEQIDRSAQFCEGILYLIIHRYFPNEDYQYARGCILEQAVHNSGTPRFPLAAKKFERHVELEANLEVLDFEEIINRMIVKPFKPEKIEICQAE